MPKATSQDLHQRFVALLFNTRNRIRFAMDDRFKPLGITDATWRTLFFLRQDNGPSQKQLALTMGIEGPSLVRLLDQLETKGFIERRTDANDRRSKTIHLTDHADSLLADLDKVARSVRADLTAGISEQDLAVCVKVMEQILIGSKEASKEGANDD
ncbi:MAG: MarR family transcriptional regulator for hemolysin [Candidatus Azotimanducaceae bacterium]|jgi:MarR family transcriptional regulator for hemolysin